VWAVAMCSVLGCGVDSWMCTDFEYCPIAWYLDWLFRLDQMRRSWKLIIVGVWLCGRDSAWLWLLSYGYCSDCEWFLDDLPWVWDLVELVDFVIKIESYMF
jgi:hypothetical protein